jgi:non-ribosomal peptide synthetase component F
MIVLRTNLSGNPSFRELLGRVRETTLGAYAHQDLPFEKLVEEMQPRRDLSYTPLFQVVFTLQNAPLPPLELPGLTLGLLDVDQGTAKFDLVLNMWDLEQGLTGALEYNTDIFLAPTAARMLGRFERLLGSVAARPEARLDELEMLSEEESAILEEATDIGELDAGFSFQAERL